METGPACLASRALKLNSVGIMRFRAFDCVKKQLNLWVPISSKSRDFLSVLRVIMPIVVQKFGGTSVADSKKIIALSLIHI